MYSNKRVINAMAVFVTTRIVDGELKIVFEMGGQIVYLTGKSIINLKSNLNGGVNKYLQEYLLKSERLGRQGKIDALRDLKYSISYLSECNIYSFHVDYDAMSFFHIIEEFEQEAVNKLTEETYEETGGYYESEYREGFYKYIIDGLESR